MNKFYKNATKMHKNHYKKKNIYIYIYAIKMHENHKNV